MVTANQVKALVRCHVEGDDGRFHAIALQLAAKAARQGHSTFARELREIFDQAKPRVQSPDKFPKPMVPPRGELMGLLTTEAPKTRFADMALDAVLKIRIERVLAEQRQRCRLQEHGFRALRKLLLVGPPGTGKTMTAAAIAGELDVPLFSIQLHGLLSKFMGETAAKLRLIFDAIQLTRGVYLFDEFDALGAERGSENDVGEIRRVLNSLLQFLEQDESDSLIVAATNLPQRLDRALLRRFDAVIEYQIPSADVAEAVMRARLANLDTSAVDWQMSAEATHGLSHADIVVACEQAGKNAILAGRGAMHTDELVEALRGRCTMAVTGQRRSEPSSVD